MTQRHVPPHHAVDRPSLRLLLDEGRTGPATLIVAPAGAGKSVLISQWAAGHDDLAFVWIDVGPDDVDAAHFARRLTSALNSLSPGIEDLVAKVVAADGGLGRPFVDALSERMRPLPECEIVLDDLHLLANEKVLADLWALVDTLPEQVHLVLSSRRDFRLGWAPLRLRYNLLELRQSHLAFGDADAAEAVARISGRALSPEAVSVLVERTEGWAAGVQLAALTLRDTGDPEAFVSLLVGSDRLIADYLGEEVLLAQPQGRREMLLRLSALTEMNADLVAACTGEARAAGLLESLQEQSMFVLPVAGRPGWYRFHHLFRELLRYRLHVNDPAEEAAMLVHAAEWSLEHDSFEKAIGYFLEAERWDSVLDVLLARGSDVFERGETATMLRWLDAVPERVLRRNPDAQLLRGILLGLSGHGAQAEDILRELCADPGLTAGQQLVAQCYLTGRVQLRPNPALSLTDAEEALRRLTDHDGSPVPDLLRLTNVELLWPFVLAAGGRSLFLLGRLAEARSWLQRGLDTPGGRYSAHRIHLLGSLALVDVWEGDLDRGLETADEAIALAREVGLLGHPAPADAHLARCFAAIGLGRTEAAIAALRDAEALSALDNRTQLLWLVRLAKTLILGHLFVDDEAIGPPPPVVAAELARAREAVPLAATISPLPVPLTDRERELLAYFPSRYSNAELAARLFVSVNTIKTHMAHIYRKLDAPDRDAAILRARELGLL
ncbi:helix-turn-helix transcriptional regulator [Herbiconiux ginsengi]|uniref:LuxR family transcriptional regulator, maltose regulon positive regulatory protein n=1 Tax=Herbiconiux ginsengi TaxID=381665 RepID=A0A1H3PH73_9MICO|nr:LuxR C-terminal-related transcriptional regulator [Herbiconiux ginsengi]SDZ00502.1 LuxR family transcriptional regulator, maltose regulon positive regulatory protein [Herbiconiux ginsengi]